jgi:hypothetical protein
MLCPVFPGDRTSRKIAILLRPFLFTPPRIFAKSSVRQADQKSHNLPCDDRFTALMPAEMSHSNRLRRRFQ